MDTLQTVKELAAAQFGTAVDTIDADASVDKLGMDSLDFLEFLFALEDRLKISIPQPAVAHVKTLRELAKAIDGVIAATPPAAPPTAS
jgi:acyl carrier protein